MIAIYSGAKTCVGAVAGCRRVSTNGSQATSLARSADEPCYREYNVRLHIAAEYSCSYSSLDLHTYNV